MIGFSLSVNLSNLTRTPANDDVTRVEMAWEVVERWCTWASTVDTSEVFKPTCLQHLAVGSEREISDLELDRNREK